MTGQQGVRLSRVRDWSMTYFSLIYALEALCEPRGIIGLPLMRYGKEVLGWTPLQLSSTFALFALPWLFKPALGALSDLIPIFGSRRRSYILLASAAASGAWLVLGRTPFWTGMLTALMVQFVAMALISATCGGLLVEQRHLKPAGRLLVSQQWLALSVTSIAASAVSGWIAGRGSADHALRTASQFLVLAPISIGLICFLLVDEPKGQPGLAVRPRLLTIWASIRRGGLLFVAVFLFVYMFRPSLYVPLYYRMREEMHFSQEFLGTLGSMSAAGAVCGALACRFVFMPRYSARHVVQGSLALGAIVTVSFLALSDHTSALLINFLAGFAGAVAIVVSASLAADVAPKGGEALGYAILASVENLAIRFSDVAGSYVYTRWLPNRLWPLVALGVLITAVAMLLATQLPSSSSPETTDEH